MLRAMTHIATRRRWQLHLVIGHVQHHLRDDAQLDAQWTKQLAMQLDLPFEQRDLKIDPASGNVEDMAREQRYKALIEMAEQHNCHSIVTAHHGIDQLETLLMRLIRGTSLRGMGAMAWARPLTDQITLIRPMLRTDRSMVINLLQHLNQNWCEDHTNHDTTRQRAAIRHRIIPEMTQLRPDLPQQITNTTDQLRSIVDMLQLQCQQAVTNCLVTVEPVSDSLQYCRKKLKSLHPAMQTMVLRQILIQAGVHPDRLGSKQLAQFGKMCNDQDGSVRQLTLGRRVMGTLDRNHLTLRPTHTEPKARKSDRPATHMTKDIGIEDC